MVCYVSHNFDADMHFRRTTQEDPYILAGGFVPKAIDLFANINLAFQIGLASRGSFENLLEPRDDAIIDAM